MAEPQTWDTGLLTRRIGAAGIDLAIWTALTGLLLAADQWTGWLSTYDGRRLGIWLLVVMILGQEIAFLSTVGKHAVGIQLQFKGDFPRLRVLGRGLVFWILVLDPGVINPFRFDWGRLDLRTSLLLGASVAWTTLIWTLLSPALSRGAQGFHDLISGCYLSRGTDGERRRGLSLQAAASSIAAAVGGVFTWMDWTLRISETIHDMADERLTLALPSLELGLIPPSRAVRPLVMSEAAEAGVVDDWFVPGSVLSVEVPVPLHLFADPPALEEFAHEQYQTAFSVHGDHYDWIVIELSNYRQVGMLSRRYLFHWAFSIDGLFAVHPVHFGDEPYPSSRPEDGTHATFHVVWPAFGWRPLDFRYSRGRTRSDASGYWDLERDLRVRVREGAAAIDPPELVHVAGWSLHLFGNRWWPWWVMGHHYETQAPGSGVGFFRVAVEVEPMSLPASNSLARSLMLTRREENTNEALSLAERWASEGVRTVEMESARVSALAVQGDTAAAQAVLDSLKTRFPASTSENPHVQYAETILELMTLLLSEGSDP